MDLFNILVYAVLVAAHHPQEDNNLIIPSWLFREQSSQANLPTRLDLPEPVPPPSAWSPLIPFWLFQNDQENESGNFRRQNTSRSIIRGRVYNELFDVFDSIFEARIRQSRGLCGMFKKIETVKFTDTKEKPIDEGRNTECPITYDEIKYGDSYLSCDECKYNFSESAILKHLNSSNDKKICPMCRDEWKNFCRYINKDIKSEMKELKNTFDSFENKNLMGNYKNKKIVSELVGKPKRTKHNKRWYYGK
jgi:hypothetical protein